MKIKQFTMAALATVLIGSSLAAQQTLPGQTQTNEAQARQRQEAQRQEEAQRQGAQRQGAQRQEAQRQPTLGQPIQDRAVQAASGQRTLADSPQSQNQTFAKCLAITNQEQVLIARFAQEKATHDDVKAFAATLEKDHQSCVDELRGLDAKSGTDSVSANQRARSTGDDATDRARRDNVFASTSAPSAGQKSSTVDFLQLHQEMSEQCLKDSKEMLSKKSGSDFDKCFVGMQVAKHATMHSSLTVLERHATGELQDLIKKGLEKNEEHLQAAISLMENLESSDSSRTNRNSE